MNKYWMVHNTSRREPVNKIGTLQAARDEAKRLAIAHPGETIVVLEAVAAFGIEPQEPKEITIDIPAEPMRRLPLAGTLVAEAKPAEF